MNTNIIKQKCLHLSLMKKWYEMSKAIIKKEDYREINSYWIKRLLYHKESILSIEEITHIIKNYKYYETEGITEIFTNCKLSFKKFEINVITLGYPKASDSERIIRFEHQGIEIGKGNPAWGAEPNKLYFIIKHGNILKKNLNLVNNFFDFFFRDFTTRRIFPPHAISTNLAHSFSTLRDAILIKRSKCFFFVLCPFQGQKKSILAALGAGNPSGLPWPLALLFFYYAGSLGGVGFAPRRLKAGCLRLSFLYRSIAFRFFL